MQSVMPLGEVTYPEHLRSSLEGPELHLTASRDIADADLGRLVILEGYALSLDPSVMTRSGSFEVHGPGDLIMSGGPDDVELAERESAVVTVDHVAGEVNVVRGSGGEMVGLAHGTANAWAQAMLDDAGVEVTADHLSVVSRFIRKKVEDGQWAKIKRLLILGNEVPEADWVDLKTGTSAGSWMGNLIRTRGWVESDGVTGYGTLGESFAELGVTSANGGVTYLTKDAVGSTFGVMWGASQSTTKRCFAQTTNGGVNFRFCWCTSTGAGNYQPTFLTDGVITFNRYSGGGGIGQRMSGYQSKGVETRADAGTMADIDCYIFGTNTGVGAPTSFSKPGSKLGFFCVHEGLTASEQSLLTGDLLALWEGIHGVKFVDYDMQESGAFNWSQNTHLRFGDYRLISNPGYLSGGGVMGGQIVFAEEHVPSGRVERTIIRDGVKKDDHSEVAFYKTPDGRLRAYMADHGLDYHNDGGIGYEDLGGDQYKFFTCETQTPGMLDWGALTEVGAAQNVTYMNAFDFGGRMWLMYRHGFSTSGSRWYRLSTDNGATFGLPLQLVGTPYVFFAISRDGTKMHCFARKSATAPGDDVYYFICHSNGDVTHPDGTSLGNWLTNTGLPVLYEEGLQVYDRGANVSTFQVVRMDEDDNPVLILDEGPDIYGDMEVFLLRFVDDSSLFTKHSMGVSKSDYTYTPGADLIDGRSKTVFFARKRASGLVQIEKIVWNSDFTDYSVEVLYSTDSIIRTLKYFDGHLYWLECEYYTNYTNWRGALRRIPVSV